MTEPSQGARQRPGLQRRSLLRQLAAWMAAPVISGTLRPAHSQETPMLKVGFLVNYIPFSFHDKQGQLQGFDVEVVDLLCRHLGMRMVPVAGTMAQLQRQLKAGDIQLIGNQLLNTVENRREFDLVRPYAVLQLVCAQHEDDNRDFLRLDDFFGHKLGVLARTGVEEQARSVLGKNVVAFEKLEDGLKLLAAKKIDAVLDESLIIDYHIEQDELPIKTTAPFAAPKQVGLALRKGDRDMQERLNAAVATTTKAAAFKAVSEKWFGYDVSRARVGHADAGTAHKH